MRNFNDIAQEATGFGIALRDGPVGCIQFWHEGRQIVLAHMWPLCGRKWRGYVAAERNIGDRPRTYTGRKGYVADWCLDIAVNF